MDFGLFWGVFALFFPGWGRGGILFRWLTVFPGCALMFRFGALGGRVYAGGGLVGVRAGKTVRRIEEHKKSPPCVKGGRGGSRRGDRRGWDVSLFRATDCVPAARVSRTCGVLGRQTHGPATSTPPVSAWPRLSSPCAGEALDRCQSSFSPCPVLSLRRGGSFWGEKYRAGRGWVRSARWGG